MKRFALLFGLISAAKGLAIVPASEVLVQNEGSFVGVQKDGKECELSVFELENRSFEVNFTYLPENSVEPESAFFENNHFYSNPEVPFFVAQQSILSPAYYFYFSDDLKLEKVYRAKGRGQKEIECRLPEFFEQKFLFEEVVTKNFGLRTGVTDSHKPCSIELAASSEVGAKAVNISYTNFQDKVVEIVDPYAYLSLGSSQSSSLRTELGERLLTPRFLKINFDSSLGFDSFKIYQTPLFGVRPKERVSCTLRSKKT